MSEAPKESAERWELYVGDVDTWFVKGPADEMGPLPWKRLAWMIETGAIPPDALVRNDYSRQQSRAAALLESMVEEAKRPEPYDFRLARATR